ncbi:hypothetical protein [Neobacillus sp. NPDC093127]|uniref:hypothetical protein n=1 Tax=Neobacillus sp. NPDC093127 TaxID=3364296 RepID=UPI00380F90B7
MKAFNFSVTELKLNYYEGLPASLENKLYSIMKYSFSISSEASKRHQIIPQLIMYFYNISQTVIFIIV